MLKIKDNVDLKELEKYGFTKPMYYKNYICGELEINEYKRLLYCVETDILSDEIYDLDTLYDLIKDGLVEKID